MLKKFFYRIKTKQQTTCVVTVKLFHNRNQREKDEHTMKKETPYNSIFQGGWIITVFWVFKSFIFSYIYNPFSLNFKWHWIWLLC